MLALAAVCATLASMPSTTVLDVGAGAGAGLSLQQGFVLPVASAHAFVEAPLRARAAGPRQGMHWRVEAGRDASIFFGSGALIGSAMLVTHFARDDVASVFLGAGPSLGAALLPASGGRQLGVAWSFAAGGTAIAGARWDFDVVALRVSSHLTAARPFIEDARPMVSLALTASLSVPLALP